MAALDVAVVTFIASIVALGKLDNEASTRFPLLLDKLIAAVACHNFTRAKVLIPSARIILINNSL
jgi:hypothetical protein